MNAWRKAAQTHYVKGVLLALLWVAVAILFELERTLLLLGVLVFFLLGIWVGSSLLPAVGKRGQQVLGYVRPLSRDWGSIFLGIVLGAVLGSLLFFWLAGEQGFWLLTSSLAWWVGTTAVVGAFFGRRLVNLLTGISLNKLIKSPVPFLRYWGWRILLLISLVSVLVYILHPIQPGQSFTTVLSEAVPLLIITSLLAYWVVRFSLNTQTRMVKNVQAIRKSPRWIHLLGGFVGVIFGFVLLISVAQSQTEPASLATANSAATILLAGTGGWTIAQRLWQMKRKPARNILLAAILAAVGGIILSLNLSNPTSTSTVVATGGILATMAALVLMRPTFWLLLRVLGIAALGVLFVFSNFGLAQINALAGIFFGLIATMMIFNWVTRHS